HRVVSPLPTHTYIYVPKSNEQSQSQASIGKAQRFAATAPSSHAHALSRPRAYPCSKARQRGACERQRACSSAVVQALSRLPCTPRPPHSTGGRPTRRPRPHGGPPRLGASAGHPPPRLLAARQRDVRHRGPPSPGARRPIAMPKPATIEPRTIESRFL